MHSLGSLMLIFVYAVVLVVWLRYLVFAALGIVSSARFHDPVPRPRAQRAAVSVIIPALNESSVILGALESLAAGEFLPSEVFVVDDGSSDVTADVARRGLAKFPLGSLLRHPLNLGKAAALNTGLCCCRSDYVLTMDADTRLSRGALAAAVAAIEFAGADALAFSLDVSDSCLLLQQIQRQEYRYSLNVDRAAQAFLCAISVLPGAATLFRRTALEDLRFSGRTCAEDADLTLHLARRGLSLIFASDARAMTLVPRTLLGLIRQRTRWIRGAFAMPLVAWLIGENIVFFFCVCASKFCFCHIYSVNFSANCRGLCCF